MWFVENKLKNIKSYYKWCRCSCSDLWHDMIAENVASSEKVFQVNKTFTRPTLRTPAPPWWKHTFPTSTSAVWQWLLRICCDKEGLGILKVSCALFALVAFGQICRSSAVLAQRWWTQPPRVLGLKCLTRGGGEISVFCTAMEHEVPDFERAHMPSPIGSLDTSVSRSISLGPILTL